MREPYEERIVARSQQAPHQRTRNLGGRWPPFNQLKEDFDREDDFNCGRGRGGYHEDQRSYHGERAAYGPPYRRKDPYFYRRGSPDEPSAARPAELRSSSRVTSQPSIRGPPQPLMSIPFRPVSTDRGGDERNSLKRKALSPPARDRFPPKKGVPSSSQAHSSRHSPERNKTSYPHLSQPKKIPHLQEKEGPPSNRTVESQEESPHSSAQAVQEDRLDAGVEQSEAPKMKEDAEQDPEMRRAYAIANKALEIEKLYRQDCETFGMVVKMLAAKQPSLEKQLLTSLKENLTEIKDRCLDDLRNFISEVNVVLKSD